MISHTFVGVNDFDRIFTLYSALMAGSAQVLRVKEQERPRGLDGKRCGPLALSGWQAV
jgi:hypothetical protein